MTAKIIQFGQPRSRSQVAKRSLDRTRAPSLDAARAKALAKLEESQRVEKDGTSVRCTVDGRLYEVRFYRGEARTIHRIVHRSRNGRIAELKYRQDEFDPLVVNAARRESGRKNAQLPSRDSEAAIAQLWARHARLLRDVEKVKAMIALMERDCRLKNGAGRALTCPAQIR
jgi:superfamily II helicase